MLIDSEQNNVFWKKSETKNGAGAKAHFIFFHSLFNSSKILICPTRQPFCQRGKINPNITPPFFFLIVESEEVDADALIPALSSPGVSLNVSAVSVINSEGGWNDL